MSDLVLRLKPVRELNHNMEEFRAYFVEGSLPGSPSLVEVTITDGTEVTEFGTLNKWTVTAPVTLTLPEAVDGAGHLVHVDRLDRITWPAGTEVHGATEGLTEAWLSLVGDDGHWTVLVSSSGEGTLPEGMEYDPDTGGLTMGDGNNDLFVLISPIDGFQAAGSTLEFETQIGFTPDLWTAIRYSLVDGHASGFYLSSNGLVVVDAGVEKALGFPAGESWTTLPEEGTESAIHTLATREWVESQTPLPKSVASVEDLSAHTAVGDGHSTLVVALGKPVWSLGSTFVDAMGTQVWPT